MRIVEDAVRELGGVWPSSVLDAVYLYRIDGRYIAGLEGGTAHFVCTRTEFEECARRLRNEPDWKDAPDWAVAKAQDSDGEWYWYEVVPRPGASTFMSRGRGGVRLAGKGEVIGDWKQTLKLRPEGKKMEDENDWYKRGELPPVGAVCEVLHNTAWRKTKIIGWDGDDIVYTAPSVPGGYYGIDAHPSHFRPLQTERERWISEAQEVIGCDPNAHRHMLGQLYDAGLAKMPEDK